MRTNWVMQNKNIKYSRDIVALDQSRVHACMNACYVWKYWRMFFFFGLAADCTDTAFRWILYSQDWKKCLEHVGWPVEHQWDSMIICLDVREDDLVCLCLRKLLNIKKKTPTGSGCLSIWVLHLYNKEEPWKSVSTKRKQIKSLVRTSHLLCGCI